MSRTWYEPSDLGPQDEFAPAPDFAYQTAETFPSYATPAELTPPELLPAKPPGPGLGEAMLWTIGVLLVHAIGMFVAYLSIAPAAGRLPDMDRLAKETPNLLVAMLGIEQLVFVGIALAAAALRFRGRLSRSIPAAPIRIRHAVIIGLLVFPLALTSSRLSEMFRESWNEFAESIPGAGKLEQIEAIELLSKVAAESSFPLLLLVIAVAPAIGEELVFRGVIGRGLTARWGLVGGVLITSVLFGFVHLDPVHVVGVIPLGIAMHVIYLATGSFWAPVLFHFANNTMAAMGLRMAALGGAAEGPQMPAPELPAAVYATAAVCVISLVTLLWGTRVRYQLPDGSIWNPRYPGVDPPPEHVAAVPRPGRATPALAGFAALSVIAFVITFVTAVIRVALNV